MSKPGPTEEGDIKPDWKDFVAMVMAAYSILLPPLLVIFGTALLVLLVLYALF